MSAHRWLACFAAMQLADWATTLAVLHQGGVETNVVVRAVLHLAPAAFALALPKLVALTAGLTLYWTHRYSALALATLMYVGVVGWNLVVLVRLAEL